MMMYQLVFTDVSQEFPATISSGSGLPIPKDGGSRLLQNTGNNLPMNIVSYTTKLESSSTPM
jgi:hypothetical protein